MNNIEFKVKDLHGKIHTIKCLVEEGLTLKDVCKEYDLFPALCGGMVMCGTCHCYIIEGHETLWVRQDIEEALLSELFTSRENSRLGCQVPISKELNGMLIELADYNL
ncbi:2Fe-2S iron-sulfur cluster-binding protein [Sphingobacterium faecium]|uniref:2Fe-2S iron-sulfur cluster-binding protein n=1 Tax=Sphingobacterium faecium TaxID=34087 RepID=UPI0032081F24